MTVLHDAGALDPDTLSPHTVAVMGLGSSGISAARFLAARGIAVLAWDQRPEAAAVLTGLVGVTAVSGSAPAEAFARCGTLLLSPGIPRNHPGLAPALRAGVTVINDVEWLARHLRGQALSPTPDFPAPDSPALIAVTGTNGKSTVTTLVGQMLAAAGRLVRTGGNLGPPALSLWQPEAEFYVLELSSFQLESTHTFRPRVATLLNLSPDHLDRYADTSQYLAAKKRVFARQGAGDWAVINGDDPHFVGLADSLVAAGMGVIPFSTARPVAGGVCALEGWLTDHRGAQPVAIMPLADLKMAGGHNQANAAAAAATALAAGARHDAVAVVLKTFPGLPHRMEWVRRVNGVDYYNDSKGTNVGAVVASLQSFSGGVILIAGGRDKKGDFSPLVPLVERFTERVLLLGEAAPLLEQALSGRTRIRRVKDMADAVRCAHRFAHPGGTVLLSPACASFDMFRDFEQRGECFREAVHGL